MASSNNHFTQPCLDVYHDQTYTLRKFIDEERYGQDHRQERRVQTGQSQSGDCSQMENWSDAAVNEATKAYLQVPQQNIGRMAPRSNAESGWASMSAYPTRIPKRPEQWQRAESSTSQQRLEQSLASQRLPQPRIIVPAIVSQPNPPYIQTAFDNNWESGLDFSYMTPGDQAQTNFSSLHNLVSPASDALFSSFQESDVGSPTEFSNRPLDSIPMAQCSLEDESFCSTNKSCLNVIQSDVSNRNSIAHTVRDWSGQLESSGQGTQQMHGLYQASGSGPNTSINPDEMVGMVPSQERSSAPPSLSTSGWCTPEFPYQCSPPLTTSFSSCGTPDTPVTPVSPTINELGYPHLNTIPWADSSSFRALPSSSGDAIARSLSCRGRARMAARAVSQRSESKDAFLVQCKLAGMSYKEIKEKGQFSEAESTLRGRFRTLTKRKEHRVRKPEWHGNDLRLLCEAVKKYTDTSRRTSNDETKSPKVSWKLVGEYIWKNGGSYHFGNATCKKKWEEIEEKAAEQLGN